MAVELVRTGRPFIYAGLPTILAVSLVLVSGAAELILDHDILGRDASGTPALASLPVIRTAIDIWNMAVIYLAPPALAIGFLILGVRRHVSLNAVIVGGIAACVIGAFLNLDAVWTGIPGTSRLDIGTVPSLGLGINRVFANLVLYGIAAFLVIPRRH